MSATYLLDVKSPPGGASDSAGHSDAIWCSRTALLLDGTPLIATTSADRTVKLWDTNTLTPTQTFRPSSSLGLVGLALDPSPTGASFLLTSSIDSVLSRWDLSSSQSSTTATARAELGPAESWRLAIHPSGQSFVTAGMQCVVKVLKAEVDEFGEELASVGESSSGTFALEVVYSNDGRFLAVSTETGHVTLYDAATMGLLSTFPAHSSPIRTMTFTSNLLITASDDKRINIFDLRSISGPSSSVSAGGGRKGQVASLGGHEGWVTSLSARNDRLLASGSSDGTIKLWDLAALSTSASSSAISTLRDDATVGDVWALSWLPDSGSAGAVEGLQGAGAGIGGGRLLSGSEDGVLRCWRGGG